MRYDKNGGSVAVNFFQQIHKDRNVYENVAFAQRIIQMPGREIRKNVPSMLSTVTRFLAAVLLNCFTSIILLYILNTYLFPVPKSYYSGKSTLIKLLLRELLPTSGRIVVNGTDVVRLRRRQIPKFRRNMGVRRKCLRNLLYWVINAHFDCD